MAHCKKCKPCQSVPLPPNCDPCTATDEADAPVEPGCIESAFDAIENAWTKPADEEEANLPVCNSDNYAVDMCVFVIGSNGKGGVYKVTAIIDETAITVTPHTIGDLGGAGNVVNGRIYPMAYCPLGGQELLDVIEDLLPDGPLFATGAGSGAGFSLTDDGAGNLTLNYNSATHSTAIQALLLAAGLNNFIPAIGSPPTIDIHAPATFPDTATPWVDNGSINLATAFGTTVPAGVTHVALWVRLYAKAENTTYVGYPVHFTAFLQFGGLDSTKIMVEGLSRLEVVDKDVSMLVLAPVVAGSALWTAEMEIDITDSYDAEAEANYDISDGAEFKTTATLAGWLKDGV